MLPRLFDDVSFCQVNGHWVFLDLGRDRYFRLPQRLEQAFAMHLQGDKLAESDRDALVKRNILIDIPATSGLHLTPTLPPPIRSALEQAPVTLSVSLVDIVEVFAIVCSTYRQLKVRGLKCTLTALDQ